MIFFRSDIKKFEYDNKLVAKKFNEPDKNDNIHKSGNFVLENDSKPDMMMIILDMITIM